MAGYPGSDEITTLLKTVLAGQKALEAKVDKNRIDQLHLLKDAHNLNAQAIIDAGYEPCELLEVGFGLSELARVVWWKPQEGPYSVGDNVVIQHGGESMLLDIENGPNDKGEYLGIANGERTRWMPGELIKGKTKAIPFKQLGFSCKACFAANIMPAMCYNGGFTLREIQDNATDDGESFEPDSTRLESFLVSDFARAHIRIKELGFTATACKTADVPADVCYSLGYTLDELKDAGFKPEQFIFPVGQPQAGPYAQDDLVVICDGDSRKKYTVMQVIKGPHGGDDDEKEGKKDGGDQQYYTVMDPTPGDCWEMDPESTRTIRITDIKGPCALKLVGFDLVMKAKWEKKASREEEDSFSE